MGRPQWMEEALDMRKHPFRYLERQSQSPDLDKRHTKRDCYLQEILCSSGYWRCASAQEMCSRLVCTQAAASAKLQQGRAASSAPAADRMRPEVRAKVDAGANAVFDAVLEALEEYSVASEVS